MKVINSTENRIYKMCIKLGSKKYRDRLGLYIIEGEKLVKEAESAGMTEMVIIKEDHPRKEEFGGSTRVFMKGSLFDKAAQTKTTQGVFAVAAKKEYDPKEFFEITAGKNLIVLDRLQDPGNIGTIIRTAEAAGYGGAIIMKGSGDIYSSKAVRAAAGSILRFPVMLAEEAGSTAELLLKNGRRIISTKADAKKDFRETDLTENTALVIGNEGKGVSDEFISLSGETIKIPMKGEVDSLNAAVAAGILMYRSVQKG